MYNVLIIGYGVVGKNLNKDIQKLNPDIYDKYNKKWNKLTQSKRVDGYDIAFICVDTPFIENDVCDYSEIINAINENNRYMKKDGIFVIKSTILPKYAEKIIESTNSNIVFSPEYYGNTQHNDNRFNFTILGFHPIELSPCILY